MCDLASKIYEKIAWDIDRLANLREQRRKLKGFVEDTEIDWKYRAETIKSMEADLEIKEKELKAKILKTFLEILLEELIGKSVQE